EKLNESLAQTKNNWVVTNNDGTITYNIDSASLSDDTVTLTLAAVDPSDNTTYITNSDIDAHIKVTPSTSITDVAGNSYAAGQVTESGGSHTKDITAPTVPAANIDVNNSDQPHIITVRASEKLNQSLAQTASNWAVTNNDGTITYNIDSAFLSDDTVTLTLAAVDPSDNTTYITNSDIDAHIKVTPSTSITDVAGNNYAAGEVTESGGSHTQDTTAPTAAITYSDADGIVKFGDSLTITATFNEDMVESPVPKIAISGANSLSATGMTKTYATLYTYIHSVGVGDGTATIALSNGTDFAGNVITSEPTSGVSFTVDNTAPTVKAVTATSVHAAGDTIAITFSEAMDTSTITNAILQANSGITLDYSDNAGNNNQIDMTVSNATVAWTAGNTVATITLDEATDGAYIPNGKYIGVTFASDVAKDVAGNSLTSDEYYSSAVSKETTAPTISVTAEYVPSGNDTVTITSNEVLAQAPAQTLTNWVIYYDADQVAGGETLITTTNASISDLDPTKKIITITLDEVTDGAYLPNGYYIKVVPDSSNITDLASNAGVLAAWTDDEIGGDTTAPTFTVTAESRHAAGDTITLTFNEIMDTTTLTNANLASNIELDYSDNAGGLNQYDIVITNATVAWDETKKIATITLDEATDGAYIPDNKFVGVTPVFGAVKDLAGNAAEATEVYTSAGVAGETTAPEFSSVAPESSTSVNTPQVSYTLSEICASGTITWTRTGGSADAGSPHKQALTGEELNSGEHSNILLTNSPTLVDGAIYTLQFAATDLVGNTASVVQKSSVTYDTTSPFISSVSVTSSNSTSTLAKAGDTVTYSINYNEAVTATVNSDSTANNIASVVTQDVSASSDDTDTIVFTVTAGDTGAITPDNIDFTIEDAAGNSSNISSLGEITGSVTADTTVPTIISISTNLTNDQTGEIDSGELEVTTVFSETMKTSATPTVAYDPAGPTGSQSCTAAACASGGGWSSTNSTNDTYKACNVNAITPSTGDGQAVITVSAAEDLAANKVTSENFTFTILTTRLYLKVTDSGSGDSGTSLSSVTAGTAYDLILTVKDESGAVKTDYTGTIAFTSDDENVTLPDTYTFTADDKGKHIFTNGLTLITKGSKSITAEDTTYSSVTVCKRLTVNSAATAEYTLSSPADITAGNRAAYTLTRYDQYGNLQDVGAETVYLTSNSTGTVAAFKDAAVAGNTITTITLTGGSSSANFWYYDTKAGNWTITVSDAVPADGTVGIDDATDSLGVVAADASKYKVTSASSSITAGDSVTITVTAYDTYNNVATGYDGNKTLYFTGADPSTNPVVQPTCTNNVGTAIEFATANIDGATICTFADGVTTSTITMTLYKAQGAAIKAHNANPSLSTPTITTASTDDLEILVNGGATTSLSWYTQPQNTAVANAPWKAFAVSVSDDYGNVSPSSATITITPSSGIVRSSSCTWTAAASSGVATFNNFAVYSSAGTYPAIVTLTASTGDFTSSASNSVTLVEKYTITLNVKDSVTLGNLTDVSLTLTSGGETVVVPTHESPWTGNSPFQDNFVLPYGDYSLALEKDQYVPTTIDMQANTARDGADSYYDNNITWDVTMTSIAESLADYKVIADIVYDETNDVLTATSRLERRGQQKVSDGVNNLGTAAIAVYDGETLIGTLTDTSADAEGNYWFSVAQATSATPSGFTKAFVKGKTYYAKCTIAYGGVTGDRTTYASGTTFTITTSQELTTLTDLINTTTSAIQTATTSIASQTSSIKEAVRGELSTIDENLTSRTGKILTAAETTIPTKLETERAKIITDLVAEIGADVEPHIQSGILNRESSVKQGDTVTIRYRTGTGLSPIISVYDPDNSQVVSSAKMTEVGTTGIYEYDLKFESSWGKGDFTILTSEATKGTVDAMIMSAVGTDLEDVSGNVAAVLGSTAGLSGLDTTVSSLDSQLSTILTAITALAQPGGELADATESTIEATLDPIVAALKKVTADIKAMGGAEGYNLDDLFEITDKQSRDVKSLANKTIELKKILELIQGLMERKFEEPVIKTWYESGSVVLRVLVVNPSKNISRTVPFKFYLPREVKSEHIMHKGELELGYDAQQGLYYVYKDIELEPAESKRLFVEIEDIWVIDPQEIESLETQAKDFAEALKESSYTERSDYLMSKIARNLSEIKERQGKATNINPEQHISAYRENVKLLDVVKEDVLEMERLASRVVHVPPTATWRMIIMIVIFLAILSLVFFIIWQSKLKEVAVPAAEEEAKKEAAEEIEEAESRQQQEEKKIDINDIKKRMEE
ncbi:MAG: hypothetical protein DRP74_05220, partial [Candidatus Omnitrophota bacterium]